jgi:hypothetical protein
VSERKKCFIIFLAQIQYLIGRVANQCVFEEKLKMFVFKDDFFFVRKIYIF